MTDPTVAHPDKPMPWRAPTMDEVRAVPWNGLNVVSTFSGCGGSSTGYRLAGYRVLAAVEFVPAAQESYDLNRAPYTQLVRKDVRDVTGAELLKAASTAAELATSRQRLALKAGDLDLFDGSPPCEPFSSAGRRDERWGTEQAYSGQRQRTDDLFYEYARLVDEIQPKVFIAENVQGLVRGRALGYFKRIHKRLQECGYQVEARILDAQWMGIPQKRNRLIFVGVRNDLADRGLAPAFPTPLPWRYTVREALPHVFRHTIKGSFDAYRQPGRNERSPWVAVADSSTRPAPTITAASTPNDGPGMVEAEPGSGARFTYDTDGANQAKDAGERDRSSEPAPTIVATGRAATHYTIEEPRAVDDDGARVVHETHGQYRTKGDVSDRPAPCVRTRPADLTVEEPRAIQDRAQGFAGSDDPKDVTDRPAPTIVSGGGNDGGGQSTQLGVEQPSDQADLAGQFGYERRKLTIPELKALCGFPDDYQLHGSYGIQWERLGDSVPPLMMEKIAVAVRDEILTPATQTTGR